MKLTIPPLEISNEEGFSSKDIFDRKDFGERLARVIDHSNENLVIALDARWGEGKTTFVKMWKGYISKHREKKFKSVYFDAFANDYQKDPFLALAAEIYELIKNESNVKKTEFKEKAGKAIKSFARGALKIGVRAATAGMLDSSIVEDIKDDISEMLAEQTDKVIAARLENSEKDKSALQEFKKYLEKLANTEGNGNPVVFIIDELDRCRPDFALELIEQIKHVFSVKGIIFLLVLNREQLEASICNRYGHDVKAAIYLQKFITLWLSLPRKAGETDHGSKYFKYSLKQMLEKDEKVSNELAIQTLEGLIKLNQPSYREIEHILSYFALMHNMIGEETYRGSYQLLIAFICYLKSVKPHLIELISSNSIDAVKLIRESGLDKADTEADYSIQNLINHIHYDLAGDKLRSEMVERQEIRFPPHEYGSGLPKKTMVKICRWLHDINIDT